MLTGLDIEPTRTSDMDEKKNVLFRKKEPKNFYHLGFELETIASLRRKPKVKSFFASFFQKRSASLLPIRSISPSLTTPASCRHSCDERQAGPR